MTFIGTIDTVREHEKNIALVGLLRIIRISYPQGICWWSPGKRTGEQLFSQFYRPMFTMFGQVYFIRVIFQGIRLHQHEATYLLC